MKLPNTKIKYAVLSECLNYITVKLLYNLTRFINRTREFNEIIIIAQNTFYRVELITRNFDSDFRSVRSGQRLRHDSLYT